MSLFSLTNGPKYKLHKIGERVGTNPSPHKTDAAFENFIKYKANETTAITIKHKLNTAKGIIPVSDSNRKCFSFDGNGSCINVPCK